MTSIDPSVAARDHDDGRGARRRRRALGVDGCGAPAHVLARGLASAFATVAVAGRRVASDDGPSRDGRRRRRDVTTLMEHVPGLMAKDGAEGVFAAALP